MRFVFWFLMGFVHGITWDGCSTWVNVVTSIIFVTCVAVDWHMLGVRKKRNRGFDLDFFVNDDTI